LAKEIGYTQIELSAAMDGLRIVKKLSDGLYVNLIYDKATGLLMAASADPEAEYREMEDKIYVPLG
jgi:hypothetical protein